MDILTNNIRKLITKLKNLPKSELYYECGTVHEAIAEARLNGLYIDMKDIIVYLNRYVDDFEYFRIVIQIKTQNNAKVKNIETIMKVIKSFESHFIYIDKIKVYQQDGVIYLDIYRLDNEDLVTEQKEKENHL